MSFTHLRTTRLAGLVAAAALAAGGMSALAPSPARAADPQVCVTGPAATPATQPWLAFAESENQLWEVRDDFPALAAVVSSELRKLGPTTTEAQVEAAADALGTKIEAWTGRVGLATQYAFMMAFYELRGSLLLAGVAPADVDAALEAFEQQAEPLVAPFLGEALQTTIETYTDAAQDQLVYPVPAPVVVPSPDPVVTILLQAAQGLDKVYDLARTRVVYSGTAQTCTTTSSLAVPTVSTVVGNAAPVTVNATREGRASRGDFSVLVDGRQVASASNASSVAATVPATLSAGSHILTVAFAPVDGSPVSTQSAKVTVAKAKTKTTLKLAKAKVDADKPVTATVKVAAQGTTLRAAGTVSVKIGDTVVKAKVKNGKATLKLGKPAAGSYKLKASYAGNGSFVKSTSKKVTLTVSK